MNNHFEKYSKELTDNDLNSGIALFGAGQNGCWCMDYLIANNYNVMCFIDNSTNLQGEKINDIPVYSYQEFLNKNLNIPILITAKHAVPEILKLLKESPLKMSFDNWFYNKNKKHYDEIRNILRDEKSKLVLDNIIKAMKTGDEQYCAEIAEPNQYFCIPQFFNTGHETFVDLGAYVGDTVEKFINVQIGSFKHIYAFEIGKQQITACKKRFARLVEEWGFDKNKITLVNLAIGEKEDKLYLKEASNTLSTSTSTSTSGIVPIYVTSMDKYFENERVSFIKVDIEGGELGMLRGCANVIRRDKPKFALSVYHRPDDLINSIEYLKNINPEYKFSLRQHSPLLMDTTLYVY